MEQNYDLPFLKMLIYTFRVQYFLSVHCVQAGQVLSRAASFHHLSTFSCFYHFRPFSFSSKFSFTVSTAFQVLDLHRRAAYNIAFYPVRLTVLGEVYSSSDRSLKSQACTTVENNRMLLNEMGLWIVRFSGAFPSPPN